MQERRIHSRYQVGRYTSIPMNLMVPTTLVVHVCAAVVQSRAFALGVLEIDGCLLADGDMPTRTKKTKKKQRKPVCSFRRVASAFLQRCNRRGGHVHTQKVSMSNPRRGLRAKVCRCQIPRKWAYAPCQPCVARWIRHCWGAREGSESEGPVLRSKMPTRRGGAFFHAGRRPSGRGCGRIAGG